MATLRGDRISESRCAARRDYRMNVFYATPEQENLIGQCKKLAEKIAGDPTLIGVPAVIDLAKALVNAAAEAGLPAVAWTGLQLYVSMDDNDQQLPKHLRAYPASSDPR